MRNALCSLRYEKNGYVWRLVLRQVPGSGLMTVAHYSKSNIDIVTRI